MLCLSHPLFGGNVPEASMAEASMVINSFLTSISGHKGGRINFKSSLTLSTALREPERETVGWQSDK